jgi:hypothetical protein
MGINVDDVDKSSGKQVFPDLIDVSGTHGYHQIIFSAICQ